MSLEEKTFGEVHHAYFGIPHNSYLITGVDFIDNAPYVLNKYYE